jgi:AcrR family transcriptional regulator
VAAAEQLLRERPFRELTVDEVMRRTGLSRPSFYVYFKDRHELILRLVQHLASELLVVANTWFEASEPGPQMLRQAWMGIVEVYGQHGPVLRALADAAVEDPDVEQAYGQLVKGFVDATAHHLAEEMEAGTAPRANPTEIAKAIVWMAERYLYHSFAPGSTTSPEEVVETMHTVILRAMYADRA